MHGRADALGVVRACIQLAASTHSHLPHVLTYTFITDIVSFIIRFRYNTIGLSKPSDRSSCSLSSQLRCSEIIANKQPNSILRSRCRFTQTILPRLHSQISQHECSLCTRVVIGFLHAPYAGEGPVHPPPSHPGSRSHSALLGFEISFLHSITPLGNMYNRAILRVSRFISLSSPPLLISRRSVGSILSSENFCHADA